MSLQLLTLAVRDRHRRLTTGDAGWDLVLAILAVGLPAILALYWEAAVTAVQTWSSTGAYGHGFFIVPICAWMIWRERRQLAVTVPRPSLLALPLIAAFSIVWLLAEVTDVNVLQQFGLVAVIQAFCLSVLGWRATKIIAFPLVFLVFAVPFGDYLTLPLQRLTAHTVVWLIRETGIPVYLEGLFFVIPAARFEVAEACSGIRYLVSLTALGVLSAHLLFTTLWRRVLVVVLFVSASILANTLRAYGIVMIAHLSELEYAVGTDHLLYGWLFFGIVSLGLLAVIWRFREESGDQAPKALRQVTFDAQAFRSPRSQMSLQGRIVAGALALGAAMVGPVAHGLVAPSPSQCLSGLFTGPRVGGTWLETATTPHRAWSPSFGGASAQIHRTFGSADGREVQFFAAIYPEQRQGAELIGHGNRLFNPNAWSPTAPERIAVENGGSAFWARSQALQAASGNRLIWSTYWVSGEFTTNALIAKLLQIKPALLGGQQGAAVVAVSANFEDAPLDAARTLQEFLGSSEPLGEMLARQLGGAAGSEVGPTLESCN